MKLKNFTLTLLVALVTFTSCKKLINNSITVNTDAITAKFKSGTIAASDVNNNTTLAKFVQANMDLYDTIQKGVAIVDANGYTTTMTDILDGKISQIVVENTKTEAEDPRSFVDYYTSFGSIWVKFTTPGGPAYDPNEAITAANGYSKLCDTVTLASTDSRKFIINIAEADQKNLRNYVGSADPINDELRTMIVVAYGVPKAEITAGNEFNLKVSAKTNLSLVKKDK